MDDSETVYDPATPSDYDGAEAPTFGQPKEPRKEQQKEQKEQQKEQEQPVRANRPPTAPFLHHPEA